LDNLGNTQASRENDLKSETFKPERFRWFKRHVSGTRQRNQITLQDGVPGITNQYLFQPIAAALYSPVLTAIWTLASSGTSTHTLSRTVWLAVLMPALAAHKAVPWRKLERSRRSRIFVENGFVPTSDEDPTAVGIYATQNKKVAIRNFSLAVNPLNYGNVGYDTGGPEVHSDGEVWNGTNWKFGRPWLTSTMRSIRTRTWRYKNPAQRVKETLLIVPETVVGFS